MQRYSTSALISSSQTEIALRLYFYYLTWNGKNGLLRAVQQDKCACWLHIYTLWIPIAWQHVIRPINELSIKLTFNDRFGCPLNAMCVWVMIWGFISKLITSAICWKRGSVRCDHQYRWYKIYIVHNLTVKNRWSTSPILRTLHYI